jgi:inactivated superfamily I helicase
VEMRVLGGGGFWLMDSIRGYAALLTADQALARQVGRSLSRWTVPAAVRGRLEAATAAALAQVLHAEGNLLLGDKPAALATARSLRNFQAQSLATRQIRASVATTLAWAGAQEEAVTLLEELATQDFGLAPAEITREPLFTIPLKGNPRFQVLVARLEAQMAKLDLK